MRVTPIQGEFGRTKWLRMMFRASIWITTSNQWLTKGKRCIVQIPSCCHGHGIDDVGITDRKKELTRACRIDDNIGRLSGNRVRSADYMPRYSRCTHCRPVYTARSDRNIEGTNLNRDRLVSNNPRSSRYKAGDRVHGWGEKPFKRRKSLNRVGKMPYRRAGASNTRGELPDTR